MKEATSFYMYIKQSPVHFYNNSLYVLLYFCHQLISLIPSCLKSINITDISFIPIYDQAQCQPQFLSRSEFLRKIITLSIQAKYVLLCPQWHSGYCKLNPDKHCGTLLLYSIEFFKDRLFTQSVPINTKFMSVHIGLTGFLPIRYKRNCQ